MSLVRVKHRYQITIPPALRRDLDIHEGDVLSASKSGGGITLRAQRVVDREIAAALAEVAAGDVVSFASMDDMIADLRTSKRSGGTKKRNHRYAR